MLTRRDFLLRTLGAAAVAAVPSSLLLETKDPAVDSARWNGIYRFAHEEAWRILQTKLQLRQFAVALETRALVPSRLWDRTLDGVVMTHQFSVALKAAGPEGEREISPAMQMLAADIELSWLDRLGRLDTPNMEHLIYGASIGPLRLIVLTAFDPVFDTEPRSVARFDILGGTTPAGAIVKERRRQGNLARRIRARLMRPTRVLPLPA